ncbi:glutathione S-transferase family protein [Pacificimonas sp. ICDLI1SI03]
MKLFWSSRSPFARKALMVAHEVGLANAIELIPIAVPQTTPNPEFAAVNPIGKLPTLVMDDGLMIADSPVIAEYLNELGRGSLFPAGAERWTAMTLQGMADELLAILLLWRAELRRPVECRSEKLLTMYQTRLTRGLDWCESVVSRDKKIKFTVGTLTLGVLLSYIDFRFPEQGWRTARPALQQWYKSFEKRPSAIATNFAIPT